MESVSYFMKQLHKFAGRSLYYSFFGMIVIGFLDSIGIFLLIPLLSITGIFNMETNQSFPLSDFFTFFQTFPPKYSLIIVLGLYISIILAQNIFQRQLSMLSTSIQQGYLRHLKEEVYRGLLQARWKYFLYKRKSDLNNIMASEINRVAGGTHFFLQFIASLLFTAVQVAIALWLSPLLTGLVIFFGIILSFFSRKLIKQSKNLGGETYELSKAYFAGISDHMNGIKDIKSNNLEGFHYNWFRNISIKMESNVNELAKVRANSQFLYKVSSGTLIAIFMYFAISLFYAKTAELMLIVLIFSRLWPKFTGIQSDLEQIAATIPSFKALISLLKTCEEEREILNWDQNSEHSLEVNIEIKCTNVSFRYHENDSEYALRNINLSIPSNQMTAIVGRSGAGKSTLIDILMGLMTPKEGLVSIDGTPLGDKNLLMLRRTISYVPQDPFLFNTTIRENLLLIRQDATDVEIWESLEFSSAADFVKKLPNGLDTMIGDRGIRLSGGERQRLVLARAILKKPSILVLDEATSALDTVNEAKIQQALTRIKGKMTIIVIAHRMSTIRNADQVIVLENGEVIQTGGYHQLSLDKKGMFRQLLGNQLKANS
ncbi:ABC transporter ATP-binding protein [Bacillus sp. UMB0893]|uniref:ABC transporter ATP-binding protein n=1 Tax=Bacillus sp. UMB0893 TaxID=2066053 RepID=UPI000C77DA47|nr:ABC transporter ATP-binding protein [Bacillus sp. UMB0893]PLR68723.1 ABC transporter ATP-binding protein [Bacillus sp. UMB0893]